MFFILSVSYFEYNKIVTINKGWVMEDTNQTFNFFSELESRYGFRFFGEVAYANLNGFHYSLNKENKNQYCLSTSINFNQNNAKNAILKALVDLYEEYKTDNTISENHIIAITFNAKYLDDSFFIRLESIINKLNSIFLEYDLKPSCWHCNKEGDFPIFKKEDTIVNLCDNCTHRLNLEYEKTNLMNNKLSYFKGFVGALLGTLLMGLVWMFLSYLELRYSIVSVFFGFSAVYGYTLFKGKIGKGMFWALFLAVTIGVVGTHILETSLNLYFNQEFSLSFLESIMLGSRSLFDSELFHIDQVWMYLLRLLAIALTTSLSAYFIIARREKHVYQEPLVRLDSI